MMQAQEFGYHCEAITIDHRVWVKVSRPRILCLGCLDSCGGGRGVRFVVDLIVAVDQAVSVANRVVAEPDIFKLVDVNSAEEAWRRKDLQDLCSLFDFVLKCFFLFLYSSFLLYADHPKQRLSTLAARYSSVSQFLKLSSF